MNLTAIALVGLGGFWLYRSRQASGSPVQKTVKGETYMAVYQLPEGVSLNEETQEKLVGILPPGSNVTQDGARLVTTMTAVSTTPIGDIPTPLGVIKLVTLKRVSDVVSGTRKPEEKLPTTFSWWTKTPGVGLTWNGYTAPVAMSQTEVNSAIIRRPSDRKLMTVWRHNGKSWMRIYDSPV